MATYISLLVGLIFLYFALNLLMHSLPEVEAGPTSNVKATGSRIVKGDVPASYWVRKNGKKELHRKFVIRGNCMVKAGFAEGDIVDVRIFNKQEKEDIRQWLSENDIVLIRLYDRNFRGYKLRIIKELRHDDAKTYYYEGNEEKSSSKPHRFADIIGIAGRA